MPRWVTSACLAAAIGSLVPPLTPIARAQAPSDPAFAAWVAGVRAEALARGLRADTIAAALDTIEAPVPSVIERDQTQAELVLPLEAYLRRHLTTRTVAAGRRAVATSRQTLDAVAARYDVPAAVLAGIWGTESNFGRFSGVRPTISALATLAYDGRRATFFREELLAALTMLDRGDVTLSQLRGSWAGAMGQPQFMPTSYLRYAEDFDGDGRRDIWANRGDVLASIAGYLRQHGWTPGLPWGREVTVDDATAARVAASVPFEGEGCRARREMTSARPLSTWTALGIRVPGRSALAPTTPLRLVSGTTRHFLVTANYDALLSYNCAHAYALTVALLGERVVARRAAAPRARR